MFKGMKKTTKNAILLGGMCCLSYLAVYIARNVLSAVTPSLIENGIFTEKQIGNLSSIYFIAYAIGQLINGIIGDKIKAKYMMNIGLILAGIAGVVFPVLVSTPWAAFSVYGFTGFLLSMIYAPMTKVVAENTEPIYAERTSIGYTFASFLGSPIAGLLAGLLIWRGVFNTSGIILTIMGVTCFLSFTLFEKKKIIQYNLYKRAKTKGGSISVLFKRKIVKFTIVSITTGVVRTTVVFWMPTYFSQHLGFSPEQSANIFAAATLVISFSAIIALMIYEKCNRNIDTVLFGSFVLSAVFFLLLFMINSPILNIIFFVLAVMSANSATTMLWSVYCPSLKDTGVISSATGFLDFASYSAAAVSSTLFANAVQNIGWGNLILIWCGLMSIGVLISIPKRKLI